ncbi:hypothetical protein FOZ62_010731, partial [Perkinsus olseni]
IRLLNMEYRFRSTRRRPLPPLLVRQWSGYGHPSRRSDRGQHHLRATHTYLGPCSHWLYWSAH